MTHVSATLDVIVGPSRVRISAFDGLLCGVRFVPQLDSVDQPEYAHGRRRLHHPSSEHISKDDRHLLDEVALQLEAYLSGRSKDFDLPIREEGTPFQKRVWSALREIPYGETASYGEIAQRITAPNAARAVGGANNRNPLSIITPCHRVIGAGGQMTGYAGGVDVKKWLLALEAGT